VWERKQSIDADRQNEYDAVTALLVESVVSVEGLVCPRPSGGGGGGDNGGGGGVEVVVQR
jgi:hypothetical protein